MTVEGARAGVRGLVHGLLEVRQTVVSNGLIIIASFGSAVLAARLLGPEGRGTLAAAVVYVALASALADGGLNQAVPYFAARHQGQAASVLGTTVVLATGFGSASALVAYGALSLGATADKAVYYLPATPFVLLATHLAGFLYGRGEMTAFNIIRILQASVLLLALVASVIFGRTEAPSVLAWAVGVNVTLALAAAAVVCRRVSVGAWRVRRETAKDLLDYAWRSHIGNVCWLLNSRLDQVLMSLLVPAASLGVYATSMSYAGVVFSVFSAFAMLAFAKAARVDPDDHREIGRVVRKQMLLACVTGVPVAVTLALSAPWLYPVLFGDEFAAGIAPARILCAASVWLGLNYILSNGLRARNEPLKPSIAEGAGLLVSAVAFIAVMPRGTLTAIACVPLVSYITIFGVLSMLSRGPQGPQPVMRTVQR